MPIRRHILTKVIAVIAAVIYPFHFTLAVPIDVRIFVKTIGINENNERLIFWPYRILDFDIITQLQEALMKKKTVFKVIKTVHSVKFDIFWLKPILPQKSTVMIIYSK